MATRGTLTETRDNISSQVPPTTREGKNGGWITSPFILVTNMGLILATGGVTSNLIVYLINKYNVKSIDASQIYNIVNGCTSLAPIGGAIIADSYLGCFFVISISSFIFLLGVILVTLTATLDHLRPLSCTSQVPQSCKRASTAQAAVLYTGIALMTIGIGGTRFNVATFGANQLDKIKDQDSFFHWYFFTMYVASVTATVGFVYVQDNVGWGLGFGLCIISTVISLVSLVLGSHFYRHVKPAISPFKSLARVLVAAIKKRKLPVSPYSNDYYYGNNEITSSEPPSSSLSFLNKAALKVQGEVEMDGSISKPWRLCTVENVQDFKTLLKIIPLWSTTIFLSTPIAVQMGLTVVQALSMDRKLGPHFSIPAGSFLVFSLLATAVTLPLIDRSLCPMWTKLTGRYPTPLQRIGLGHLFNIISLMGFAFVENRRLGVVQSHNLQDQPNSVTPISALWLVVPLAIIGFGEALHFPAAVAFYYQEFPKSLRNTATSMITLVIGISFYLSTTIISLTRRVTTWLPDNINRSRLDYVYWMMAVIGLVNFGYFLWCARLYEYQNIDKEEKV